MHHNPPTLSASIWQYIFCSCAPKPMRSDTASKAGQTGNHRISPEGATRLSKGKCRSFKQRSTFKQANGSCATLRDLQNSCHHIYLYRAGERLTSTPPAAVHPRIPVSTAANARAKAGSTLPTCINNSHGCASSYAKPL